MSSSSTIGRPFTGRLRSSSRPGTAEQSKDGSVCSVPSTTKWQDGSNESNYFPRSSTYRTSSTSIGGHEGGENANASSHGVGCRSGAAPPVQPDSAAERTATPGPTDKMEVREINCGLKHGDNGNDGAKTCCSLTDAGLGHWNAPEDKRAARRRRRAEAAAAAAAAALESEKANETCGLSRAATLHASLVAGTDRTHSRRPSARGHSGVESKTGRQPSEHSTHETPLSASAADFVSGETSGEPAQPPGQECSLPLGATSADSEASAGSREDQKIEESVRTEPSVEVVSSLHNRMSSEGAGGSGATDQEGPKATDLVAVSCETDAICDAVSVGLTTISEKAQPADSDDRVSRACVTGSWRSDSTTPTASSAAESSVPVQPVTHSERGGDYDNLLAYGTDSDSLLESPQHDKSVFNSASQGSAEGTGLRACLTETQEQAEQRETSASSSRILHANASRETPRNTKMSTYSSCTDSSTTSACSESARQAEYSSGVCRDDAGGVGAAEGPLHVLGSAGGDPRESQSVSPVASESLMKSEKRQCAQLGLSEDGAQHDNVEMTNMRRPVFRCSTIPEPAKNATTAGDSLPAPEGAAMRDTAHLAAPDVAASLRTTTDFHLTPVLHGLECLRGELLLNREEFEALQGLLRPLFYRLVPCVSPNECLPGFHDGMSRVHYACGDVRHQASVVYSSERVHKEGKPSSRRLAQEVHALQQAACAFAALPSRGSKRRREPQHRDFHEDEAEAGSATYSSSRSSGGSFCSIGTHRRDHDGAGEDGEGNKGHDTSPVQETGRRRQQPRARKLPLRLDEDIEDEEGVSDVFRGYRRNRQARVSASEAVERLTFVHSDDDELSAVSAPTARRVRGTSSNSWKRMQSFDDAVARPSIIGNQQLLHTERQMGRGGTVREGRGGKGACMEAEACASTEWSRGLGVRGSGSKGHRRRHLPKANDCDGFDRVERNECSDIAEETETRLHGSRRLWDAKQKKRRGVTVSLGTRSGQNSGGSRFSVGPCGSTTASCSSPLFQISSTTDWRESCFKILQHLKCQPAARWFLSQNCDASPGYAGPSVHRVYLQDIEQKLTSFISDRSVREAISMSKRTGRGAPTIFRERGYVHPCQWQQEVRQIFFHAFTFHPVYHEIWRDAAVLAAEFERCCRLVHQVNPYYPSMFKRRRYSGRAVVPGGTQRSAEHAGGSGISGASMDTANNNRAQLPVPCIVYGGSTLDLSARAPEARSHVERSEYIPGPGATQPLHQAIPLIHSQQVHFSQSGPSNYSHHSAFLASGAPGTAAVGSDAFREGSAALGYTSGTAYLRSGSGKQHGSSRSSRTWGEGGVRGKRQQDRQHEVGVSEGRVGTEDIGVIRKPDGSLVYAYSGQYREVGGGIPGDEGGKSSRVMAAVAGGSPRRGGRGGARGRGVMRGGRGTALGNELRGSAPLQQQPHVPHPWSTVGRHASQGPGVVSEHRFFGTIGEFQQQPFTSGGRMVPVGVAAGGQPAPDGGFVLMGRAGVSAVTSFATGPTMPGAHGTANVLLLSSSNVLETVQQMDAPVGAPVLPPPPVPRIGVNDKPLSSIQRRTLEQNMQRLSPLQRKAALELIQDDLGILAAEYMNVKTFAFDTELLSIEKQKRLFAYVNSMFRANREILLRQHEEQVAAAQANAMSAAADGAAEALLEPSGGRRGRRKRGEASLAGGPGAVQSRSGSSTSSSGSDSDSSSSLSSSDTSSSSSSSDTEEEESEESESEGESSQKASGSTSDASSSAAQSFLVSSVDAKSDTVQGTGIGSGKIGTAATPQDTGSDVRGRAHFSGKTSASGRWDMRGGCSGEVEGDRWNEERYTTNEDGPRGSDVIDGVLQEKKGMSESSGMVAFQRAAGGAGTAVLARTTRQLAGNPDSETAAEGRLGSSLSTPDLSPPGKCVHRGNTQSEGVGSTSGDPGGLLSMHDRRAESLLESSAGQSASRVRVSACSHSLPTRRPDSCAACSPGGDEAEITEVHKKASANGEQPTENFLGSSGATVASKTSGGVGRTLPQYTPVCEEGARVEIRAEVMGRHADFLGVLAVREAGTSENEGARVGDCTAKPTAWQEWKGQVIQQGFVAQRAYASQQQRSVSEIIAERYNARI